jgi:methylated-DNA-[protein]-cysteine S-methyltransferase
MICLKENYHAKKDLSSQVYQLLRKIPRGKVTTYKEIAKALGNKNLARVAGNILNKNPKPIAIPCQRVVKSDGALGGYVFGQKAKEKLLTKENIKIKKGKVVNFKENFFRFK